MIRRFERFLCDMSGEWGLNLRAPVKFFVNNNYHPHGTNLNIFWFESAERFPTVVTKLSADRLLLENEYRGLRDIHAQHVTCAPRFLHWGLLEGFHSLWMTGVPGFQLRPGDTEAVHYVGRLVDRVIELHLQLRASDSQPNSETRIKRMLEKPLESLASYGAAESIRARYRNLEPLFRQFLADRIPLIPQHSDLFIGNVLRHECDFYFVDWEVFNAIDFPFFDLFTLLISLLIGFASHPKDWPARILSGIPALVRRYAVQLDLSEEMVDAVFLLTLLNWFHTQHAGGWQQGARQKYELIENFFSNEPLWCRALFGSVLPTPRTWARM